MSGLPPANDKGDAQKNAMVRNSAAGIKDKRRHLGPEWFDADILANVEPYNTQKDVDIPNNAFLVGQYLPRDTDLETRLKNWFELPSATSDGGNSEWGVKTQPTDLLLDYSDKKNEMAQYRAELDLAAQLINPKDPSSQKRAFAMYPELRDIPEERSLKLARFHVMIEAILRAGTPNSREEVQMVFVLLDPRTIIPMLPGWTELFQIKYGSTKIETKIEAGTLSNTLYWLFNPYSYQSKTVVDDGNLKALSEHPDEGQREIQGTIKAAIARRLFPALAEANNGAVVKFILRLSGRYASAEDEKDVSSSGGGSNLLRGNEGPLGILSKTVKPPKPPVV